MSSSMKLSQPPRSSFSYYSSSLSESYSASAKMMLYPTLIISIPVLFIFIILFLFYLFYLKRRRVYLSSLRMRSSLHYDICRLVVIPPAELGLKKEVREMLPVIVYNERFSFGDTHCSVCLGDYQAEEKLQRLPACAHTFHIECIDHWLANQTTCPLCRLSLVASAKSSARTSDFLAETAHGSSTAECGTETSLNNGGQTTDGTQTIGNGRMLDNGSEEEEEEGRAHGSTYKDSRTETNGQGHSADYADNVYIN